MTTSTPSIAFAGLKMQPPDPLLSLIAKHHADPRLEKIDLGVGVYRTGDGATPFEFTVSGLGRLTHEEEFGEVVVKVGDGGQVVKIKDVARVELGAQTYAQQFHFDGRPAAGDALVDAVRLASVAHPREYQRHVLVAVVDVVEAGAGGVGVHHADLDHGLSPEGVVGAPRGAVRPLRLAHRARAARRWQGGGVAHQDLHIDARIPSLDPPGSARQTRRRENSAPHPGPSTP